MRTAVDGMLSHPLHQQHVTHGQHRRPDEKAEKSVDHHSADDTDQNYRHRHVQSPAEHNGLRTLSLSPVTMFQIRKMIAGCVVSVAKT